MDIGAYIAKKSKQAGGMDALAAKTGVSRSQLYKLQNGQYVASLPVLEKLGLKVVEAK